MAAELLVQIGTKVSLVLLVAWVTTSAMRRSSAAARHLVWALAILAMLLIPPVVLLGPVWHLRLLPAGLVAATRASLQPANWTEHLRPDEPPPNGSELRRESLDVPALDEARDPLQSRSESQPADVVPIMNQMNWQLLLVGIWATGAVVGLLRLALGVAWVSWSARGAEEITEPVWRSWLERAAASLEITRRISLRRSERTSVPVACGLLNPTLLMPVEADGWTAERARVVLLHELAHVKRRDCPVQVIAQMAAALHWLNPLAYLAVRSLRAEQEGACDDLVLAAGTDRAEYADHLFEIARAYRPAAVPQWAVLAMARPSQLEARVRAILDSHRSRRAPSRWNRAFFAAVAIVTVPVLAALQLSAASERSVSRPTGGAIPPIELAPDVAAEVSGAEMPAVAVESSQPGAVELAQAPRLSIGPSDAVFDTLDWNPDFDFQVPDFNFHIPDFDFHVPDFDLDLDPLNFHLTGPFPPKVSTARATARSSQADAAQDETRRRIADALSAAVNDENERVRQQAIQGLAAMRDPRAIPALLKALKSPDANIRKIAISSLTEFESAEAAQGIQAALKDANADVRRHAVAALGRFRDAKYVDALAAATRDQDAVVRRQAVAALGRIRNSGDVAGALTQALKDSDSEVRRYAAASLGAMRSTEAVPALMPLLKDADARVREQAAAALGAIADPRAVDALTAALKDADPAVRERAARALSSIARGRRGKGGFPVVKLDLDHVREMAAAATKDAMAAQVAAVEAQLRDLQLGLKSEPPDMLRMRAELEALKLAAERGQDVTVDSRELVDAAMRDADKALREYRMRLPQLERQLERLKRFDGNLAAPEPVPLPRPVR